MRTPMNRKSLWLCSVIILISINLFALTNSRDANSLLNKAISVFTKYPNTGITLAKQACHIAEITGDGLQKARSLNTVAKFYWQLRRYDSAKVYGQNALLIAQKQHIDSLEGDSWLILGIIDHSRGYYQQAIERYYKSIPLYKKANKLSKIAKSNLDIGISKQQLSLYNEAIKYYLLAGNYFENLNDNKNLANTYNAIASCFVSESDCKKAIEYNIKALYIRRKFNDAPLIAQSLNNIGFVFKENHQPDSAIIYLTKSLEIRKHGTDSSEQVSPLQNLGSCWKMKGNFKKAENYISRSLRIALKYDMREEMARGDLDLAELYIAEKRYKEARALVKLTQKTAAELKLPELLMDAYATQFDIYHQVGDYKNALFYSNKKNEIKDSMFTIAKNKTISELEIQYQTSQKEKDIAALHLKNNLENKIVREQGLSIIGLGIAAVLLLLLFVIAYNNFRIKDNANKRIQTLMQDLHHRVKNNLQILSGLFMMQINNLSDENTKNALRENEARLTSMNLIHNKLYLDHTNTQIEMEEYLTKLLHHIKDSFGTGKENDINLKVEVERIMLEADKAVAIGLLINELATNAFKYAFDDMAGEIYLSLKHEGKSRLLLTLSDNGKGIEKTDKEKAPSFGLKLVNLMVRQLNATLVVNNDIGVSYQMEIGI